MKSLFFRKNEKDLCCWQIQNIGLKKRFRNKQITKQMKSLFVRKKAKGFSCWRIEKLGLKTIKNQTNKEQNEVNVFFSSERLRKTFVVGGYKS